MEHKPREFDGMHWDPAKIRRTREYGWFRQHEAEMIETARQLRQAERRRQESEESEKLRALHWQKCPRCGNEMHTETIEGVDTAKCSSCEGIFFRRGELEQLLVRHDEHQRGFFRRLLGFRAD